MTENKLVDMLKEVESVTNPDLKMILLNLKMIGLNNKNFSDWLCSNVQPVITIDPREIPVLSEQIKNFLSNFEPKHKDCYYTAWYCCSELLNVDYVEGCISFHGIIMKHAWNSYKGQHFDLTDLILYNGEIGNHYKILCLPNELAIKYGLELKTTGSYIPHHYLKTHVNDKRKSVFK